MMGIQSPSLVARLALALCMVTVATAQQGWTVTFVRPLANETTITMHTTIEAQIVVRGLDRDTMLRTGIWFRIRSENEKLLSVWRDFNGTEVSEQTGVFESSFPMEALFLGLTNVYVEMMAADGTTMERANTMLPIIIVREVRTIDHVFTGSVATLVSLLYINFGAALSLSKLKGIVRRPIGPSIGFVGQFLIMPLVSLCCSRAPQ